MPVRAWFSEDDGTRVDARFEPHAYLAAGLAVAFHVELLDVGWEAKEGLAVGENDSRLNPENLPVVEANEAQHGRGVRLQLALER